MQGRSRIIAWIVAVGLAALAAVGCGENSPTASSRRAENDRPAAPRRVVLLSVDTLRADRLACYGYGRPTSPSIDRLASEGVLLENADAPRGMTWPALTTLLTGKYPITHGVRTNGDLIREEHRLLSEILRERGVPTAGFITNMERAPNRGFDRMKAFMDTKDVSKSQAEWDRAATDAALGWLAEVRDGDFFLWVHYLGPHKPYAPEPEFQVFVDPNSPGIAIPDDFEPPERKGREILMEENRLDQYLQFVMRRGLDLTPDEVAYVNALYDGEVLCVDREIGRVLAKLDELGLAGSTLVIFTADHGEELYQRNRYFYHACSVYESVLHVPLVMRMPGKLPAGRRIADPVELAGVVPTVFDLLGEKAPPDEGIEGRSLLPQIRGEAAVDPPITITEWYEERALEGRRPIFTAREGNWKLIHNPDRIEPQLPPYKKGGATRYAIGSEELYDLSETPLETRNRIDEKPEIAARLRSAIERFLKERKGKVGTAAPMDEGTVDRLIQLGYLDPGEREAYLERIRNRQSESAVNEE